MTKRQMAKKIRDLEQRIEDLEKELQCATGRILPVDVGAARLRTQISRYSCRTDGLPERASGKVDIPFRFQRIRWPGNPL